MPDQYVARVGVRVRLALLRRVGRVSRRRRASMRSARAERRVPSSGHGCISSRASRSVGRSTLQFDLPIGVYRYRSPDPTRGRTATRRSPTTSRLQTTRIASERRSTNRRRRCRSLRDPDAASGCREVIHEVETGQLQVRKVVHGSKTVDVGSGRTRLAIDGADSCPTHGRLAIDGCLPRSTAIAVKRSPARP